MKTKITKRAVDQLRAKAIAEGRTLYLRDGELTGFGVLATKADACSFFVEYRLGGRGTPQKRMSLGRYGVLTPDEARTKAKAELGKVAEGKDVAQAKKDEREKLTGATFNDGIERFLAIHAEDTRYWKEKRARLQSADTKTLAGRPMTSITRGQIMAVIDKVQARSNASARLLFADLRPAFKWMTQRGMIASSPMSDMDGPRLSKARDRVLSETEIKAFWQATSELGYPFECVFKLLLLTGQRREEVAAMTWRELDLDARTWTIAKERAKNGKAHMLDLSPEAVALLPLQDRADEPRWPTKPSAPVFTTNGITPVSGFSKVKARLDKAMQEILGERFEPWRTHDLRRTAASGMAALGFQPHVIERVLNHLSGAQGGLVSVYQRHEYRAERKRALLAWGAHVAALTSVTPASSNVIQFRA